jgi:hypothetical protein
LDVADAVVASLPAPSSGVRIQADGSFEVTPDAVLSAGQYLLGKVVSAESRRRQDVYRSLLNVKRDESQYAVQPTLFVWTQPLPEVISVPEGLVQHGSALAAVPLWIDPTPAATEFTIPSTFLRVASVAGEKGRSLAFNSRTGKWVAQASRTTNTRLRFQLPRTVLPCRVTEARITIKLNAPSRELLVHAVVDNRDVLIERIPNPIEVHYINVTRQEWLTVNREGAVTFSFVITEAEQERLAREQQQRHSAGSEPEAKEKEEAEPEDKEAEPGDPNAPAGPSSFTTWDIEYVRMDLRGTTL